VTIAPSGWVATGLADIAKLGSGGTPQAKNPAYYGGDIPWAVIGDLNDGVVTDTAQQITTAGLNSSSAKIVPANTILLGMYGSIGKMGLSGAPMATNQAIATILPSPKIDVHFLFHYLMSQRQKLDAEGKGATQRNISQTILKPWTIVFPASLSGQRRIVEILEDHLSRLDAAADYAAAASKRLNGLRDQLVLDAITGRKIAGDRQESTLPDAGTNDGALPMLPSGWMWRRLDDVADVVGGITKDSKKQSDPAFIEVPYLRVANVQRGSLRLGDVTTIRAAPAKAESLRLWPGDVLLNEGGDRDKLARGWVWQGEIENCIHQNHVFRARIRDGLDPYFLSWTANTIGGRWAERNGKQSVNLASISLSMIRNMPVIVPPSGTASRIIQQLHDQLACLEQTSAQINAIRARGSALRQAVLVAAFTGRLTGRHRDQEVIEELADVPSSYSESMVSV
jgi:type I restriction enzyme S subunit